MKTNLLKRSITLVLAVLMILSTLPMVAFAADATFVSGKVAINASGDMKKNTDTSAEFTAKGTAVGTTTNTITVKNNDPTMRVTVEFNYSVSNENSLKFDGVGKSGSGTYVSKELAPGQSFSIALESKSTLFTGTAKLTLSNISTHIVAQNADITVRFDESKGSVTVNGEAAENELPMNFHKNSGAKLVATAKAGSVFAGWADTDGNILSTSATYTFYSDANATVDAIFDNRAIFKVGNTTKKTFQGEGMFDFMFKRDYFVVNTANALFSNLQTAVNYAKNNGYSTVVLNNNGTVPAGNYTIPSGITLLIPFDADNTLYTTTPVAVRTYVTPTAYRTLTLAEGANINVSGVISLSAKHYAANGSQRSSGSPSGNVSFIKMSNNSSITVNNGGTFYAYGFVTGTGTVTAKSGSTIYENFQIEDFRGGTMTSGMKNGIFPLAQYYVQNIEVALTLETGATEYSYTSIYAQQTTAGSSIAFISADDTAMFTMKSGSVTKRYDGATDRLIIESAGNLNITPIKMSVGNIVNIDSKDYELPINGNITVTVKSGTVNIEQDVALLPGAIINVEKGAVCNLKANMYIYDSAQWGNYISTNNVQFYPVKYAPSRTYNRTNADIKDSQVNIAGAVFADNGAVYTTKDGAAITGVDGAAATIKPGSETNTYQVIYVNAGDPVNDSKWTPIPITSAKLQNADGTFRETSKISGTTTYVYKYGFWHTKACGGNGTLESEKTPASCTAEGLGIYKCACGYSYDAPIAIKAHTPGETTETDRVEAECLVPGSYKLHTFCSVCSQEMSVENKIIEAPGHKFDNQNLVLANPAKCEEDGNEAYLACDVCGAPDRDDVKIPATGHTEVSEKINITATCNTKGNYTVVTTCSVCSAEIKTENFTDVLLPENHASKETTLKGVVAATCKIPGYSGDTHRVCCDEKIGTGSETQIDPANHEGTASVVKDAVTVTCTKDGYTGDTYWSCCDALASKGTVIEKKADAHTGTATVIKYAKAATCKTEGYTGDKYWTCCDTEAEKGTKITIDSKNHETNETTLKNAKNPTCTAEGYTGDVCYNCCGAVKTKGTAIAKKADAHTGTATKIVNKADAKCEVAGYTGDTLWTCCDALSKKGEVIKALEHKWGAFKVTKPATTEAEGQETRVCELCKKEDHKAIAKIAKIIVTNTANVKLGTNELLVLVLDETKVSDLQKALNSGCIILNADGTTADAGDVVKTGMQIVIKDGGKVVDQKTVAVALDLDCDGKVSASDARLALRASVGLEKFDDVKNVIANCDGDDKLSASDARIILRASVGLEKKTEIFAKVK